MEMILYVRYVCVCVCAINLVNHTPDIIPGCGLWLNNEVKGQGYPWETVAFSYQSVGWDWLTEVGGGLIKYLYYMLIYNRWRENSDLFSKKQV